MVYELFEWRLAVFLSTEMEDSYNDQQGDFLDAQKKYGACHSRLCNFFRLLKV